MVRLKWQQIDVQGVQGGGGGGGGLVSPSPRIIFLRWTLSAVLTLSS